MGIGGAGTGRRSWQVEVIIDPNQTEPMQASCHGGGGEGTGEAEVAWARRGWA
jgi:hypothetical protein